MDDFTTYGNEFDEALANLEKTLILENNQTLPSKMKNVQ
jgi:hypothetical protein